MLIVKAIRCPVCEANYIYLEVIEIEERYAVECGRCGHIGAKADNKKQAVFYWNNLKEESL